MTQTKEAYSLDEVHDDLTELKDNVGVALHYFAQPSTDSINKLEGRKAVDVRDFLETRFTEDNENFVTVSHEVYKQDADENAIETHRYEIQQYHLDEFEETEDVTVDGEAFSFEPANGPSLAKDRQYAEVKYAVFRE